MKEWIKNVLNTEKPSRTIIIATVTLLIMLSVGFAVNMAYSKRQAFDIPFFTSGGDLTLGYYIEDMDLSRWNPSTADEWDYTNQFGAFRVNAEGRISKFTVNAHAFESGIWSLSGIQPNDRHINNYTFNVPATIDEILERFGDGTSRYDAPENSKDDWSYVRYEDKKTDIIVRIDFRKENGQIVHVTAEGMPPAMSRPTPAPLSFVYEAREWLNFFYDEKMPWDGNLDLTLPEYPDTVFRWTPYEVKAIDSSGEKTLFQGLPVWNVYLADLTGDGLPEFCATVSFGSGIIDNRVVVYDYANGKLYELYELSDRMRYDYALSMENGRLIATKTEYNGAALNSGGLAIINGELVIIDQTKVTPEKATQPEPQNIGTTYSPDGKYFIEGYEVDYDTQVSGLYPLKQFRIMEESNGKTVWSMDGLLLLDSLPPFVWSADSRYVYIAYAGRTWKDAVIVDTTDMSERRLPGITELAPLFSDTTPDDNRPDPYIVPFSWYEHKLSVSFSWRVAEDMDNEENRIYGEYLYDADSSEFVLDPIVD